MGITPHNWISTEYKKCRGSAPGSSRTIINKREWVTLYQTMHEPKQIIPRPLSNICKQRVTTRITTAILLWLLLAQDTPHDLINAKQMAYKTYIYQENGSGRILPTNP